MRVPGSSEADDPALWIRFQISRSVLAVTEKIGIAQSLTVGQFAKSIAAEHADYFDDKLGELAPALALSNDAGQRTASDWLNTIGDLYMHENSLLDTRRVLFGLALLSSSIFAVFDGQIMDQLIADIVSSHVENGKRIDQNQAHSRSNYSESKS